jgi:hypothetical protein
MLNRAFFLKAFSSLCLPTALTVAGIFAVFDSVEASSKSDIEYNSAKNTADFSQYGGTISVSGVPL